MPWLNNGESEMVNQKERLNKILRRKTVEYALLTGRYDGLISLVQRMLDDSLRRAPWKGDNNPLKGHCYVASEAIYHLIPGMRPKFVRHEGAPHWYLVDPRGVVVDATAGQFESPVPYGDGKGKGFLTKKPSKRAQVLIERVTN